MANFKKFNRVSAVRTLKHNCRSELLTAEQYEQMGRKRENIDSSRTAQNYELLNTENPLKRYFDRLQKIEETTKEKTGKCIRKDAVTLCGWVITAPQDLPPSDERDFFQGCFDFVKNLYGEDNIISATVHKDETTPHIHISFMPIVEDKKNGGQKLCAKNLETPKSLSRFHTNLEKELSIKFNRSIGVLNGATKSGNKTLLELKLQELSRKVLECENLLVDKQISRDVSEMLENLSRSLAQKNFFGKDDKKKQFNEIVKLYDEIHEAGDRINGYIDSCKQEIEEIFDISNKTIRDAYKEVFAFKESEEKKIETAKTELAREKKALEQKEKELNRQTMQLKAEKITMEQTIEVRAEERASQIALKTLSESSEYQAALNDSYSFDEYFKRHFSPIYDEINDIDNEKEGKEQ